MGKLVDRKETWKFNNKEGKFDIEIVTKREVSVEEAIEIYKKNKEALRELKETLEYYKWFDKTVRKMLASAPEKLKPRLQEELNNFERAIKDIKEAIKNKKEAVRLLKEHEDVLIKTEKERNAKTVA